MTDRRTPRVYPTWQWSLLTSMSGELDRLFGAVTFGDTGIRCARCSRRRTRSSIPRSPLSTASTRPIRASSATTLDPAIRPGILSRAGYLAVHADSDSSGPVPRGVFMMSAILCYRPLPRPATVPPAPTVDDANKAGQTTRQRFSQHANDDHCAPCHNTIDGIGFGFEAFDGTGAYRTTENGQPIDASGTLLGSGYPNVDGPFDGVPGLVDRLMNGDLVSNCFARQVFRFAMGAVETAADEPLVQALGSGFTVDGRMTDLLLALAASPDFSERVTVGDGP